MNYNKKIIDFWKNDNFTNVKPTQHEFPEGWDVRDELVNTIASETVNEVGCGYGRLVGKFSPKQYTGYDINPASIKKSKENYPNYQFNDYDVNDELPESSWILMYTVALHVPDENINQFMEQCTKHSSKVLIAEIMGRSWRKPKFHFVFNREVSEYVEIMESINFELTSDVVKPYKFFKTHMNFLTFEKKH